MRSGCHLVETYSIRRQIFPSQKQQLSPRSPEQRELGLNDFMSRLPEAGKQYYKDVVRAFDHR